ncbi:urease accessory protein [Phreatobacter stygius]|uniref:Urease accessory protein UreD n=2 Tax=Phreatobacter stygius TaxID=1940610 RepID=A0A4D7BM33_9HYPH|nr:urease accessory protein [Phreatobacter stygius]
MLATRAVGTDRDAFRWREEGARMQRAHGVGRLSFVRRGADTVIRDCYQEAGLRIRMPRPGPAMPVEAVIINTAGGLTGGDRFSLEIVAGEGTRAVVTGQAAEKVYRSSGGVGSFRTHIVLGEAASLDWLPQEAILFDGSALDRRLDIEMAASAHLLAVESVVFGRLARGESVESAFLFERWRIRRGGRLVYAEGLRFDGPVAARLAARAAGAGAIAAASVVVVSPGAEDLIDATRDRLAGLDATGVEAGASAFDGLVSIRLLSADPFALRRGLVQLLEMLRGPLPRVWSC